MAHFNREENLEILLLAEKAVPRGLYEHYKGEHYRVIGHCLLEAVNIAGVLYHSENDPQITWVRPLDSFVEHVESGSNSVKRFTRISE